jgi:hypothetical protein
MKRLLWKLRIAAGILLGRPTVYNVHLGVEAAEDIGRRNSGYTMAYCLIDADLVGDGKTDNTPRLQRAVNAIGQQVVIAPGAFMLRGRIEIPE